MLHRSKAYHFQFLLIGHFELRNAPWQEVSVLFRWSPPTEPNGIIQRYELSCWVTYNFTNSSGTSCSSTQISTKSLEFTLQNLPTNKIHNFQVPLSASWLATWSFIQLSTRFNFLVLKIFLGQSL